VRRHRRTPISALAKFAADPEDFCRTNGAIRNKKAVKYGNRSHEKLGRSTPIMIVRTIVGLSIGLILLFILVNVGLKL